MPVEYYPKQKSKEPIRLWFNPRSYIFPIKLKPMIRFRKGQKYSWLGAVFVYNGSEFVEKKEVK